MYKGREWYKGKKDMIGGHALRGRNSAGKDYAIMDRRGAEKEANCSQDVTV